MNALCVSGVYFDLCSASVVVPHIHRIPAVSRFPPRYDLGPGHHACNASIFHFDHPVVCSSRPPFGQGFIAGGSFLSSTRVACSASWAADRLLVTSSICHCRSSFWGANHRNAGDAASSRYVRLDLPISIPLRTRCPWAVLRVREMGVLADTNELRWQLLGLRFSRCALDARCLGPSLRHSLSGNWVSASVG